MRNEKEGEFLTLAKGGKEGFIIEWLHAYELLSMKGELYISPSVVRIDKSVKSTVEGRAKQTAKEIGDALKKLFQKEGWIN